MIKLTLINNNEILINTNTINKVEPTEPTKIILKDGQEIEVIESAMTILNLIQALTYRDENNP
ncbi:MAG: flagellar FlbD family protein [Candidatus Aminicenantes bacterium]|nr:flagellar FlbD family protein [Candidatus Aminicenantes bacterium]MCK5005058.1 flagellar FlbD family protein [Candidatus Aminicenantes bacterium]